MIVGPSRFGRLDRKIRSEKISEICIAGIMWG